VLAEESRALDSALMDYGVALRDAGGARSDFTELLNALQKEWAWLKRNLPGAWEIDKEWHLAEPSHVTTPVPAVLVRAVAYVFIQWGLVDEAVLILLGWEGALRPGDLAGLRAEDVRLPIDSGNVPGMSLPAMFLILRFSKTRRTSARVQTARIIEPALIHAATTLWRHGDPDRFLFTSNRKDRAEHLSELFRQAVLRVPTGIQEGFVLSGLRPGGLTALFERCGDLRLVQWRARHDVPGTLAHYIHEWAGDVAWARLPRATRDDVLLLSARLPESLGAALRAAE